MTHLGSILHTISYMALPLLLAMVFHEYAHGKVADAYGDHTAREAGRLTLNPLAHIDLFGTVVLPLLCLIFPTGVFLGYAKPVPVNPLNFHNPRREMAIVAAAGPLMNLLLAIVIMGLARVGLIANYEGMVQVCLQMAHLSLLLCFFNLLPIPPLDGAQVVRSLIGMSYEAYYQFARYGFIILIIVIQIPIVQHTLRTVTNNSWAIIANWFGVPLP